MQKTILNFG